MKYHTPLITAALLASLITGCSKHSPAAVKVTDLGVVEVSDGETSRRDLGDGRVCIINSTILKDPKVTIDHKDTILKGQRIALIMTIEEKDANGNSRTLPGANFMASPDQTIGFSDGVVSVSLKPHIKQ